MLLEHRDALLAGPRTALFLTAPTARSTEHPRRREPEPARVRSAERPRRWRTESVSAKTARTTFPATLEVLVEMLAMLAMSAVLFMTVMMPMTHGAPPARS